MNRPRAERIGRRVARGATDRRLLRLPQSLPQLLPHSRANRKGPTLMRALRARQTPDPANVRKCGHKRLQMRPQTPANVRPDKCPQMWPCDFANAPANVRESPKLRKCLQTCSPANVGDPAHRPYRVARTSRALARCVPAEEIGAHHHRATITAPPSARPSLCSILFALGSLLCAAGRPDRAPTQSGRRVAAALCDPIGGGGGGFFSACFAPVTSLAISTHQRHFFQKSRLFTPFI